MMDSSSLDHQHHEELFHGSSSLAAPSFHVVGSNHEWNQNLILNGADFIPNVNGVLPSSRDIGLSHEIPLPSLTTAMVHDLGFHWPSNEESYTNHSAHQLHLAKIKEEISESFPKFSGVTRDPSNLEDYHLPSTSYIKHEQGLHEVLEEKLLLRSMASGINGFPPPAGELLFDAPSLANFGSTISCGRGNFSMVLPTANISSLNPPSPSMFPISLGMDLQALDFLGTARSARAYSQASLNSMAFFREDTPFGPCHPQEFTLPNSHHKIPSLLNGVTEAKRSNGMLETKASQAAPKKPRFESRSSFSPFKVRKEKLGDRIAALQQLVAPFGKTDTASVLMEAIGYIKFLQEQVETLSVPYMRSSGNKKLRKMQGASSEEKEEAKTDLRSRGLCLVPLSCTSYVTNENGGIWSPPNYRGATQEFG